LPLRPRTVPDGAGNSPPLAGLANGIILYTNYAAIAMRHLVEELSVIIEAEVTIQAPLPVVWNVFSQLDDWEKWNTACNSCRFTAGEELAAGACFTFVVKPIIFPVRVEPRVVSCDPGREVTWEGARLGIHAVHTWRFRETPGGVVLKSVETFKGPLLVLGYLVGVPRRLHRLTEQMLDQIRRQAETCGAAPARENSPA
jgi:hypothetical protein